MTDRIYVTYTPTTARGAYHTTIHYERTDSAGKVLKHVTIEGQPENLKEMSASDKAIGVVEEAFRKSDSPSRFGRIDAYVDQEPSNDPNASHEIIAEGDDLSANLTRMQLFAQGVNRAGFAYRGQGQNSNSFASAALRAGELPPATGVAHDPAGPPGELGEFFAPGLNEPLNAPIGPSREAADVGRRWFDNRFGKWGSIPAGTGPLRPPDRSESFDKRSGNWGSVPASLSGDTSSPVLRALEHLRSAAPGGVVSTSAQGSPLPTRKLPVNEVAFGDRSGNAPGASSPDAYPHVRRISSAFPGITPPDPVQPVPPPEPGGPLGVFSGKPPPLGTTPLPFENLLNIANAFGSGDGFGLLAGLVSRNPTQSEPLRQIADSILERRLGRRTYSVSPAPAYDRGAAVAPLVPSDDANFSGGLLGRFAALAGIDQNQPTTPLDDDEEQANLRALDETLSSTGNIRDAVALYKARKASQR
jgi:hypothetical protein